MIITPVKTTTEAGRECVRQLLQRYREGGADVSGAVAEILAAVRQRGDAALLEYTRKFDAPDFQLNQLKVTGEEFAAAEQEVDDAFRETLDEIVARRGIAGNYLIDAAPLLGAERIVFQQRPGVHADAVTFPSRMGWLLVFQRLL